MLAELFQKHAVIDFTVEALGGNANRVQAALAGHFQAARLGAIAEDHGNRRVQFAGGDAIGDGFEIRAAAGDQNAEALHRYSTRGPPRFCATTSPARNGDSPSFASSVSALAARRAGTARIMPTPRLNVRR